MPRNYEPEFKKKIVRLHIEQGRTYKSITEEYDVSKASISKWCSEFSEECQFKAQSTPDAPNELELMKEILAETVIQAKRLIKASRAKSIMISVRVQSPNCLCQKAKTT